MSSVFRGNPRARIRPLEIDAPATSQTSGSVVRRETGVFASPLSFSVLDGVTRTVAAMQRGSRKGRTAAGAASVEACAETRQPELRDLFQAVRNRAVQAGPFSGSVFRVPFSAQFRLVRFPRRSSGWSVFRLPFSGSVRNRAVQAGPFSGPFSAAVRFRPVRPAPLILGFAVTRH